MNCIYCGAELSEDAKFCSACGRKIENVFKVNKIQQFEGCTYKHTINKNACNGCEECVNVCPVAVYEMKGSKAYPANPEDCLGCESCIEVCQGNCITIEEV